MHSSSWFPPIQEGPLQGDSEKTKGANSLVRGPGCPDILSRARDAPQISTASAQLYLVGESLMEEEAAVCDRLASPVCGARLLDGSRHGRSDDGHDRHSPPTCRVRGQPPSPVKLSGRFRRQDSQRGCPCERGRVCIESNTATKGHQELSPGRPADRVLRGNGAAAFITVARGSTYLQPCLSSEEKMKVAGRIVSASRARTNTRAG
ncbi:hypothetical protein MRX96_031812 [Rhipicephalus microplus]